MAVWFREWQPVVKKKDCEPGDPRPSPILLSWSYLPHFKWKKSTSWSQGHFQLLRCILKVWIWKLPVDNITVEEITHSYGLNWGRESHAQVVTNLLALLLLLANIISTRRFAHCFTWITTLFHHHKIQLRRHIRLSVLYMGKWSLKEKGNNLL